MCSGASLVPTEPADSAPSTHARGASAFGISLPATPPAEAPLEGVTTPRDSDASEESSAPSDEEIEKAAEEIDLEDDPIPSGFVVAITVSKLRRLHYVGNCGRRPGVQYRSFEVFGDNPPDPIRYDKRCRQCFPEEKGLVEVAQPGAMETMDDESDSSGSSTHSSD